MTEEITLKPCPFCGGEAEIIDDAMGTVPRCRCCGAANGNGVYGAEGHKLAVKDWNTRPIEDALRAENKRLRKALENIEEQAVLKESEASNATYGFAYEIEELAREALKGGEE